jgi:predicted nucleic acid-binding protein
LADRPKYYWDACAWIALIQQEEGRFDSLSHVVEHAKDQKVEIWTSTFTLAEVYKRACDDEQKSLLPASDQNFEDLILQDFVQLVQVDYDVGVLARRLLRKFPKIQKPQDGIHLATALLNNIDELHTFDRPNLLDLSEKIERQDGEKLRICPPPKRPQPSRMPLFEGLEPPANEVNAKTAEGGDR